jgi:Xaa-Pro dipeptidase
LYLSREAVVKQQGNSSEHPLQKQPADERIRQIKANQSMVDYVPGIWSHSVMMTRLDRLRRAMLDHNLDFIALTPGPSLYYLTGLSFHLMERPVLLLIPITEIPILVAPELEISKAERSRIPLESVAYGERESDRLEAFSRLPDLLDGRIDRVGVEPTRMRYLEMSLLQEAFPQARVIPAGESVENLRLVKEPAELEASQKAVQIAEQALSAVLPRVHVGMTELELANELVIQLLRHGSESEIPFAPIVASGPNSALPHATPSERSFQSGDLLIIDWGASYKGYLSDLTRTFAIGELNQDLQQIYQVVLEANRAARAAVHPGQTCAEIDRAARAVIQQAGCGEQFIHRTGHGLGLEAHEPPYIRADNPQQLVQDMLFTIEPGVYLPEIGGVRIEDDVSVTAAAGRSLSSYSRELQILG